jgi:uncharacterized membrane protein
MTVRPPWAAIALVLAVAAAGLVVAGATSVVRAPVVIAFVLLGPGVGLVPLLRLRDPTAELALAIALSLALDVLVALTMVYARVWSAEGALLILAGVALAGAAAQRMTRTTA